MSNILLDKLDLMKVLPSFMHDDLTTKGMVYAIEKELKRIIESVPICQIYCNLENQSDEILDELANQFSISEYKTSYEREVKIKLIEGCFKTHYQRGTVASVLETCKKIYGNARIEEWFDYGGEPYHFKVFTSNPSSSDEMIKQLTETIESTQNMRSVIEQVVVELSNSQNMYIGSKVFVTDIEHIGV